MGSEELDSLWADDSNDTEMFQKENISTTEKIKVIINEDGEEISQPIIDEKTEKALRRSQRFIR